MADERAARILEEAAAELEYGGWARGAYSAWGRRCLVGAISCATRREMNLSPQSRAGEFYKVRQEVFDMLFPLLPEEYRETYNVVSEHPFITWNDDHDRKKQEVLDLLHKGTKKALGVEV